MELKHIDFMKNGWVRTVFDDDDQKRYTFIDINQDKIPDFFMVETPSGRSLTANEVGAAYLSQLGASYRQKLAREFTHWKYPQSQGGKIPDFTQPGVASGLHLAAVERGLKIYCSPEVLSKSLQRQEGETTVEGVKILIRNQGRSIIHTRFTIQLESEKSRPICSNSVDI